jgi:hypothetical protein
VVAVRIDTVADIPAALQASMERGGLVMREEEIAPQFFDLSSGLAGEVLQKFSTYRARLAIVISDANNRGVRFSELVYEHRRHPAVRFFETEQQARQWLAYLPVAKC